MGERSPRKSSASARITTSTWSFRFPTPAAPARCRSRSLLGVKYREGFIKNRYIGRTFIMPGQEQRAKSVRSKLNAIDLEFRGKNVLLVDDSIVRGTTSAQIIDMAREAGAKKVYFASAAPPVRYPNVYGIDMPDTSELVAAGHTDDEVREIIGADWLIYQDLHDLEHAVRHDNAKIKDFDTSCFSGEYVTGDVTPEYLRACRESARTRPNSSVATSMAAASRRFESCRRQWPHGRAVSLRLLVMAAHADYRLLVRKHVEIEWPDAVVVEHRLGEDPPLDKISPPTGFDAVVIVSAAADRGGRMRWPPNCWPAGIRADRADPAAGRPDPKPEADAGLHRIYGRKIDRDSAARGHRGGIARTPQIARDAAGAAGISTALPLRRSVVIRGHRCIKQVGSGGMCTIYLAESERAGTLVVLKVFSQVPDVSERLVGFDRFLQEYEIVAGLKHRTSCASTISASRTITPTSRWSIFRPAICASA
jgi:hypothetical protein